MIEKLKTALTTALVAPVLMTCSAAYARSSDPLTEHFETKLEEAVSGLQALVGLDWMSRSGFYVVAGVVCVLVLYVVAKVARMAQHADEVSRQERELLARREAERRIAAREAKQRG